MSLGQDNQDKQREEAGREIDNANPQSEAGKKLQAAGSKAFQIGNDAVNEQDPAKKEQKKGNFKSALDDMKDAIVTKREDMPKDEGEALGDVLYKALMLLMGPLRMIASPLTDKMDDKFDQFKDKMAEKWANRGNKDNKDTPEMDNRDKLQDLLFKVTQPTPSPSQSADPSREALFERADKVSKEANASPGLNVTTPSPVDLGSVAGGPSVTHAHNHGMAEATRGKPGSSPLSTEPKPDNTTSAPEEEKRKGIRKD